jgi:DNA processing protein
MSTLFITNHMKINKVSPQKHKYLQIIESIAKSPKSFYFIGLLPERRVTSVAVVGTRKPTAYGKEVTHRLAYDLAKKGVVIVSGLALGVDGIAHRAALEAGGTTVAVLANGLPEIAPSSHRDLADNIVKAGGAIISEYEPGTSARPFQFLERNRIVSGLSDAIIITEAATRSGTLSTAAHALEQGKDVFVVPGNITSPLSAGCNALLKQGAIPVTCAEDVLEVIAPQLLEKQASLPLGSNSIETIIISLLQSGIRDGDELQRQSHLPVSEFSQALTMLELSGVIRALGANQWTLN